MDFHSLHLRNNPNGLLFFVKCTPARKILYFVRDGTVRKWNELKTHIQASKLKRQQTEDQPPPNQEQVELTIIEGGHEYPTEKREEQASKKVDKQTQIRQDTAVVGVSTLTDKNCAPPFEAWPPNLSEIVAASATNTTSVIPICVNDVPTEALLDTGSALTIISHEWATRLNLAIEEPQVEAKSVSGQILPMIGNTEITITITNTTQRQQVGILRQCPFSLITGVDFLQKLGKLP